MINYLNAIIFGIVQGITEFVPISSSGHLEILHHFIKLPIENDLAFDVVLHFATFLAVVWFFRKDICRLLQSWLKSFAGQADQFSRLSWLIILATVPAGLAGFYFDDFIESTLHSTEIVITMLIIVGILFIIIEKVSQKTQELKNLNWSKALLIGLAQALALIPGTSRSGITIIAGLAVGLKRQLAVRFSFLLSVPIILAASIKKVPQVVGTNLAIDELIILIIAFITSFVSGFFAIKFLLNFTREHSLNIFAYYRFILAAVIIIVFLIK